MAFVQGHADLRVMLEAANPGAVACPRVDHNHRRLGGIDAVVPAVIADLGDTQQGIVGGPLEAACIKQCLVLEIE